MLGLFNIQKPIKEMYHISRMKDKNHIISINAERVLDKIQHAFMIKTFDELGIEENFLNIIYMVYGKATANIIVNMTNGELCC